MIIPFCQVSSQFQVFARYQTRANMVGEGKLSGERGRGFHPGSGKFFRSEFPQTFVSKRGLSTKLLILK